MVRSTVPLPSKHASAVAAGHRRFATVMGQEGGVLGLTERGPIDYPERTARVLPTGRLSRATAGMRSVAPAKCQALQDKRCRRDKNRDPGSDFEWLAGGGKLEGSSVQGGRNHV